MTSPTPNNLPATVADQAGSRTPRGRFAPGNRAAVGAVHPHAVEASRRAAEKRRLFSTKDEKAALAAVRRILADEKARKADVLKAAELVLHYRHGRPVAMDEAMQQELEFLLLFFRAKKAEVER